MEEVTDVLGNGKWHVPSWEVFSVRFNGNLSIRNSGTVLLGRVCLALDGKLEPVSLQCHSHCLVVAMQC